MMVGKRILILYLACLLLFTQTVCAAPDYDQVGKTTAVAVGSIFMTPISASEIRDGVYEVKVESSSRFFRVEKAILTVRDGQMDVLMYMSSSSYKYIYPGTAQEAAQAEMEEYIPSEEIDYYDTFTIPIDALNKPMECASFSKRKKKWYSRQILISASSLPEEALSFAVPDYKKLDLAWQEYLIAHPEEVLKEEETEDAQTGEIEAVEVDLADGEYSIEVSLSGGSGRASVTSPTWLYVKEGQAYAKLLWSSTYYDYMLVDGVRYLNETRDGSNSTFTIPILALDEPFEVIADTTAMGDPLEITYTLTFYKDTIGSKSNVPQEGAKRVVAIALFVMIGGGILNHFYKKRKKA